MKKGSGSSQMLRKRDMGILFVMVLAVYISLDTAGYTYTLEPSWFLDQRAVKNQKSMTYHGVPVVVSDLDGDGDNEVISITKDFVLQVVSPDIFADAPSDVYSPQVTKSVRLSRFNIQKGKVPVALKTGYVDKYDNDKERKKVIIVVTEDFTVACYDSNLNLKWTKSIAHSSHQLSFVTDNYRIDELDIFITPLNMKTGHTGTGTIIVGASMKPLHSSDTPHASDGVRVEGGLNVTEDGDLEHPEMRVRSHLEHFSVYALDAVEGHIVWRHDGSDVKQEQYTRSLPQQALSMNTFDLRRQASNSAHAFGHSGAHNDWSLFKAALIAELPHFWGKREDTSLRFAHFIRHHIGAGQDGGNPSYTKSIQKKSGQFGDAARRVQKTSTVKEKKDGKGKGGKNDKKKQQKSTFFTGFEAEPISISATLPHDASEHTNHPNVLVAHTKHGIQVISLKTGVPITSMALSKDHVYSDIDGDGLVDSIIIIENEHDAKKHSHASRFAHMDNELSYCHMMVVSGLPPRSQLFNGTLCLHRRALSDPLARPDGHQKVISAATPLILRSMDPLTNIEAKKRSVVVATNMGFITHYGAAGEYKWQVKNAPGWTHDFQFSEILHFDVDAERATEFGSHDNTFAHVLVCGEKELALVSRDGHILSSALLPKAPIARPVIGDFDGDGVTDVIMITEDAVLGYRVEEQASMQGMLAAVIILSMLAALVFACSMQLQVQETSAGGRKKVWKMKRSTDEYHMD